VGLPIFGVDADTNLPTQYLVQGCGESVALTRCE
jgi:hypothetical protein